MSVSVGDVIQVPIVRLALGGDSVGRLPDGRVCFVRGAPISEGLMVRLSVVKNKYTRAELLDEFDSPICNVAAACGGCPWHLSSEAQQRAAILEHTRRGFERLTWSNDAQPPSWGATSPGIGWRRTMRVHWDEKALGFFGWGTHSIVSPGSCPILTDALERIRSQLKTYFEEFGNGKGTIRASVGQDELVYLSVHPECDSVTPTQIEQWSALCRSVLDNIDGIGGLACIVLERVIFESGTQVYPVGIDEVPHHIGGFVQSNRVIHDAFVDYVTSQVEPGSKVVELFSGSGPFTTKLLQAGCSVLAIEGSTNACRTLGDTVQSWAERSQLEVRTERITRVPPGDFDVCLLDPPRAGAKSVVSSLKPDRIKRIVYVACDFGTLVRDLGLLNAAGYTLQQVRLFEMFPNSGHVECVVTLKST